MQPETVPTEPDDGLLPGLPEPPVTYRVAPEAVTYLGHPELVALSGLFRRWAVHDKVITPEQGTTLIQYSADFESLAAWVGVGWTGSSTGVPTPLLRFLAKMEIKNSNVIDFNILR